MNKNNDQESHSSSKKGTISDYSRFQLRLPEPLLTKLRICSRIASAETGVVVSINDEIVRRLECSLQNELFTNDNNSRRNVINLAILFEEFVTKELSKNE